MLKNEHRPTLKKPFEYTGSKYAHGSYQHIINEIPPFTKLVIGFLGACPIAQYFSSRNKKVECYEIDPVVVSVYSQKIKSFRLHNSSFLDSRFITGFPGLKPPFLYLDPPYLFRTRKSSTPIYNFEMTDQMHLDFLNLVKNYPGYAAISHYENDLYNKYLVGWRKVQWTVQTRQGSAVETLYCNYSKPACLESYEFLGKNSIDRQRIRRKLSRLYTKFENLPVLERNALIKMLVMESFED